MKKKLLYVLMAVMLLFSVIGLAACGGDEKHDYTLQDAEGLTASFGASYSAPTLRILRDGEDTGYRARIASAKAPDGSAVTVSYSSFTLGQLGKYTMTYQSQGLVGSEYTDVTEELSFEVELLSEDKTGPTVTVASDSEYCIWTGRVLTVPTFDAGDASGLDQAGGKTYVRLPDGTETELTERTYTPATAGEYAWVYRIKDALGNETVREVPFTVVQGPEEKENVIGYFSQDLGRHQIEAYNAELTFDAAHEWPDGSTGGTVLTTTTAQDLLPSQVDGMANGYGIDYVGAFELRQPYITDVTNNFDAIVMPVYNPNDYYIAFRAWWYSVVAIAPGDTIYYAVPTEFFFEEGDAITSGNYQKIYDVTNMTFALTDRWNSWGVGYEQSYHLPAGAQVILGDLVAMDFAGMDQEGESYYIADFDGRYANSFIEAYENFQTTYSEDDELKDDDLGIEGALVLTADVGPQDPNLQSSGCVLTIGFTHYSLEDLYEMMELNDYVSFYIKTTSRNTANRPLLGIDYNAITLEITDEWQEVRVYRSQLASLFPDVGVGTGTQNITFNFFVNGATGDANTDIEGLEVAITSLKMIKNDSTEGVFNFEDDTGNEFQLVSQGSTFASDTENVYEDDSSSVKVTFGDQAPGGEGAAAEVITYVTVAGDVIANEAENFDEVYIPLYNGDPSVGTMFVMLGTATWINVTEIDNGTWGTFKVDADELTASGDITICIVTYYKEAGPISVNVGMPYFVSYDVENEVPDELVYFDTAEGLIQTEGIRATLSANTDTAYTYGSQTGSTKVVSQVGQDGGEADMRFGVRFVHPYVEDITAYDYVMLPVYNANAYDVELKCWWSNHIVLKAGEWTEVAFSASVLQGGYFKLEDYESDAPWDSGRFFIAFTGNNVAEGCTLYLGAMMGMTVSDGNELLDFTASGTLIDSSAYESGTTGAYVSGGSGEATADGLKVTVSGGAATVSINPESVSLQGTDVVIVKIRNTSSTRLVAEPVGYCQGDIYVEVGKTATILVYGDEIIGGYEGKFDGVGADMKGFGVKIFNGESWADDLPADTTFVIEEISVVSSLGDAVYCYRNG